MSFTAINYAVERGVARMTFNRPDNMNTVNAALYDEVRYAAELAAGDDGVRVLYLTGAGERAFCAGVDLRARGEESSVTPERALERDLHPERTLLSTLIAFSKPLVAAINGVAVGGGLGIALCADIILAADTARFGTAHVDLALPIVDMLGYLLPRRVNLGFASDMAFTGRLVGADEAHRNGLVDRVVAAAQLQDTALGLCETIGAKAPLSLVYSKQALRRSCADRFEDYARYERYIFSVAFGSQDAKEAVRAGRDKRRPEFVGR